MKLAHIKRTPWRPILEDLTDEQSRDVRRVGAFIYKMVKQAADQLHLARRRGVEPKHGQLLQILRQTWKPNDGDNRFAVTVKRPAGSVPVFVYVVDDGSGSSYAHYASKNSPLEPGYGIIRLDVSPIEQAGQRMDLAISDVLGRAFHEPVHNKNFKLRDGYRYMSAFSGRGTVSKTNASDIRAAREELKNLGDGGDSEAAKKKLQAAKHRYLLSENEVESFSIQFAVLYYRRYPGQPYDVQKMTGLANRLAHYGGVNANAYLYFVTFRSDEFIDKPGPEGSLSYRKATEMMDSLMSREVARLNATPRRR